MDPLERSLDRLAALAPRSMAVVFPEGDDPRVQAAARLLAARVPALRALLLASDRTSFSAAADDDAITWLDPVAFADAQQFAQAFAANRPGTTLQVAARAVRKPLFCASMMLSEGRAQAMVAGVTCPTARVIEAAMLTVGLQEGVAAPSSFFIMQFTDRALLFADCAVNIAPDTETLAAIGVASANSCAELLGTTPRVAFLSFSTHGSANHDLARKMRDAAARALLLSPGLLVDGELQVDAALVPHVAALKLKDTGAVAGQANVLVFPDLNAANIGYKLVQHLGGAQALGPFLQGFAKPVSDLSRGATVEDIVQTAILTASRAIS